MNDIAYLYDSTFTLTFPSEDIEEAWEKIELLLDSLYDSGFEVSEQTTVEESVKITN